MKRPLALVTIPVVLVAQDGYRFPAHNVAYHNGATTNIGRLDRPFPEERETRNCGRFLGRSTSPATCPEEIDGRTENRDSRNCLSGAFDSRNCSFHGSSFINANRSFANQNGSELACGRGLWRPLRTPQGHEQHLRDKRKPEFFLAGRITQPTQPSLYSRYLSIQTRIIRMLLWRVSKGVASIHMIRTAGYPTAT